MATPSIAVIDYGMGNLRSVGKALELVGAQVLVTDRPQEIKKASAVVFPGVGSFGPAIAYIKQRGIDEAILEAIEEDKPFLGLCLGFQLLFDSSEENGTRKGLGVIPGKVLKFDFKTKKLSKLKVPHMGWNSIRQQDTAEARRMFKGIPDNSYFYFVHSFYGKPKEGKAVAGKTEYGIPFCAAVASGRTWACQFHPEKSGSKGLRLLKNFVEEAKK